MTKLAKGCITGYLEEFRANIEEGMTEVIAHPGSRCHVYLSLYLRRNRQTGELLVTPTHKRVRQRTKQGKDIRIRPEESMRVVQALPLNLSYTEEETEDLNG